MVPSFLAAWNLFSIQSPTFSPLHIFRSSSSTKQRWPASVILWIRLNEPFLITALALRPFPTKSTMNKP